MHQGRKAALSVGMVTALVGVARAAPVVVTQQRFVQTSATAVVTPEETDTEQDRKDASDFGPFDATASTFASAEFAGDTAQAQGEISQLSSMDNGLFRASGSYFVSASVSSFASVNSLYTVTFDLDEARPYRLDFDVNFSGLGFGSSSASIVFRQPIEGTPAVFETLINQAEHVSETHTGTLTPGQYLIAFDLAHQSDGTSASYSISLDLNEQQVPLPAGVLSGMAMLAGMGALGFAKSKRRAA